LPVLDVGVGVGVEGQRTGVQVVDGRHVAPVPGEAEAGERPDADVKTS